MLVMVSGVLPELVTVTDCAAELVPTGMVPKASEAGDSVSVAAVFPVRATVCVVVEPLSVTVRVAVSVVEGFAVGVNTTLMVQAEPAASKPGATQLPVPAEVTVKSALFAPEMPMLAMVSGSRVVLFSVATCGGVATLGAVLVKVRLGGVKVWANAVTQRTPVNGRSLRPFRREYAM
jgi:hypothetical protein